MIKWVRFQQQGQACWGQIHEGYLRMHSGSPFGGGACTPERLPVESAAYLPPSVPTKIVCVGRNYLDHAKELGNEAPKQPLLFLKPPSAALAPGGAIVLPPLSQQVEHEGELGIVIRKRCSQLGPHDDIRPYILGYTCVNDVTARDLQKSDAQWTRAKGFDTFCPFGPYIVETPQGCADSDRPWHGLAVETRVNGELRQSGNTADFIFSLETIMQAITAVMTLEPGDLIATGTPAGVGRLHSGDRVSVSITGIGTLENTVA